jgi:hypothetical protein
MVTESIVTKQACSVDQKWILINLKYILRCFESLKVCSHNSKSTVKKRSYIFSTKLILHTTQNLCLFYSVILFLLQSYGCLNSLVDDGKVI